MYKKFILFLICSILFQNIYTIEQTDTPVTIVFTSDQKKIKIDKSLIDQSKTLKNLLENKVINDNDKELVIKLPAQIKSDMWNNVIMPVLNALDFIKKKPWREWHCKKEIENIMSKFHDKGDNEAIIQAANILDFLKLDEMLDHNIFKEIIFLCNMKDINPEYKKLYNQLNPGLAEKIYETKLRELDLE